MAVVALAVALLPLTACSDDGPSDPPESESGDSGAAGTSPRAPGSRQTTTTVSIELPDTAAGDTTSQLRELIPMSDAEAACVTQRLDKDSDTLAALVDDIDPRSDAFDAAASIARDCAATVTYLPTLIGTIDSQHGLTGDQQACLEKAFTALNADELTALATGGDVGGSTLDDILTSCGAG